MLFAQGNQGPRHAVLGAAAEGRHRPHSGEVHQETRVVLQGGGGGGREERGGEVIKGGLEEEEECHSKCCNGTTVHLAVRTESWQPLESTLKCKHGCNAKYENDVPYHIRIPPVQQSEVLEEPDFRPQVGVLQAGTQAKLRLELLFRSGFLGIQQLV